MSQPPVHDRNWSPATWFSILSLGLGTFVLIGSEMLPVALLTPIARDLGVSEGSAGQAVTITALFAGLAAPTLTLLMGRLDRKWVVVALCLLVAVSNAMVAAAPSYLMLLIARMILGITIGGFFALAGAIVVRLVTLEGMGKGMSIVFTGMSAAIVIAPSVGAYLDTVFGWRAVFAGGAVAALLACLFQFVCLPVVPANEPIRIQTLLDLTTRPLVRVGMAISLLIIGGHFAGFAFLRPFLETEGHLQAPAIAAILLAYGLCNFAGNVVGGILADRALKLGIILVCSGMGLATVGLVTLGHSLIPCLAFCALWGLANGAAPVQIQIWMGRSAPDQLEGVGGLFLAGLQFAVALGAMAGGLAVDRINVNASMCIAAACAALAGLVIARQPRQPG